MVKSVANEREALDNAFRMKWEPTNEAGFLIVRTKLIGTPGVKPVSVSTLHTLERANPRLNFSDLQGLMDDIRVNGQQEAVHVHKLSGSAMAYVNEVNGTQEPDGTLYVVRGARRTEAVRRLADSYARDCETAKETNDKRYENIAAIVGKDVSDRDELISLIHDNVARSALKTPTEKARSFAMLRLAGRTMKQIADSHGISTSQVQTMLRITDLPNNETNGFVQKEIEDFDMTVADTTLDAKARENAMSQRIYFTTEIIKQLHYAWQKASNPAWTKPKDMATEPRVFSELWSELVAARGKKPVVEETAVAFSRLDEIRSTVFGKFRSDVNAACCLVLDVLRGTKNESELSTFFSVPVNVPAQGPRIEAAIAAENKPVEAAPVKPAKKGKK